MGMHCMQWDAQWRLKRGKARNTPMLLIIAAVANTILTWFITKKARLLVYDAPQLSVIILSKDLRTLLRRNSVSKLVSFQQS